MYKVPEHMPPQPSASITETATLTVPDDPAASFALSPGQSYPLLTFPAITEHYFLMIHGENGKELVCIKADGTVVAAYPGAEEPAARAFWQALQSYGTSIVARLRELETRLAKYEKVEPFAL